PDDRQAVAALPLERDVRQDRPPAVGLRDPFQSQHLAAAGADLLELESGVAARALGQAVDDQLLDQLDLALRLAGLGGLGAEAVEDRLVVGDLLLPLLDLRLLAVPVALLGDHE